MPNFGVQLSFPQSFIRQRHHKSFTALDEIPTNIGLDRNIGEGVVVHQQTVAKYIFVK